MVAACAPAVHRYHWGEDDEPCAAVIGVFPAYAWEFSATETLEEARHRFARMLRPTVLTREPVPYLKMRYDNTKTAARSMGPDRGVATVDVLRRELRHLGADTPGSFVEFENVSGEVCRVEWLATRYTRRGCSLTCMAPVRASRP